MHDNFIQITQVHNGDKGTREDKEFYSTEKCINNDNYKYNCAQIESLTVYDILTQKIVRFPAQKAQTNTHTDKHTYTMVHLCIAEDHMYC